MKSDLDRLMADRQLAAVIVAVDHNYSPALDYLAGNIHITNGLAIRPQGQPPVLFVNPMEIEEAAASGLTVHSFYDLGWAQMLEAANGDRTKAEVVFWGRCLEHVGVTGGKVGVYGVSELNLIIELVRLLDAAYPQYQFVGEMGGTLFDQAAITKDDDEIARVQSVAERTGAVLRATWDHIAGHRLAGDVVVNGDGSPLTIGAVKRFIRRELLDRQLEDTGMIFAQGRDAGFPHSRGQEDMPLKAGQSIVFDLFPRELGGGYHHDVTRTWCIDHAPDEVQAAYDTVMGAFETALNTYAGVGQPTYRMQESVLDYFEGQGHPTIRSHSGTTEGFVHSLGHGIGLKVHESPRITHLSQDDVFEVGNVITIEPGLYYPERGFGVRVEDALYVDGNGSLVTLTDFRKDLILPLRQ
jgi:Xaa-Pro aminopeptidase